ncbi:MAG: peptidoglycan DD-metalloendopeptidase family protein [Chloroflexi bacterium]|nr:peptidoglycan DD-metalloendopeptidase family protein [Chloroflexota bacterium]
MTTDTPVLPATLGTPQLSLAGTAQAFVNIRTGPGTSYRDIGDLLKFTLCTYYPQSRTKDGWVWIEQGSVKGWVLGTLVTFEAVSVPPASRRPYTRKVAVWHWRGDSVPENSIEEIRAAPKANAPAVTQVWVKVSDYTRESGAQWQGYWDSKRALAIDGTASIDRWVKVLGQYGLEFHAWAVPRGADIAAETRLLIQACTRPGVKSLILDVEPYAGFWLGSRETVRPFMVALRRGIPSTFHVGMCVDPRTGHYNSIYPLEWQPFVNSIHPMVYWEIMARTPDDVLRETFQVWGSYGKPIIPACRPTPTRHATTLNARFKLHGVRGTSAETIIPVDQSRFRDQWVTLGVFDIDKNLANAGSIFLNDLTGESGKEIAFDAIRWRRVLTATGGLPSDVFSDGYDQPVGTEAERRGAAVWGGKWLDASPFGQLYFIGSPQEAYHTGADLNLPSDADAHALVYSPANGIVTFANALPIWGNVIIIKHDPLPGSLRVMYSRSAHLEAMAVVPGQKVKRGEAIGRVGNAFGRYAYHLHFDLSPTNILEANPSHWPARDKVATFANYVDPKDFILANRPK